MEVDDRTLDSIAAYDANANAYQQAFRMKRPSTAIRRFAEWAGRGALVADVACGPASDLRLLTDAGLHVVGIDASIGALQHARLLMPRTALVRAFLHDLPFPVETFGGMWMSSTFTHLPRAQWPQAFGHLMTRMDTGPVYFSCYRGTADMEPITDPVLGTVHRSQATEDEVATLLDNHGFGDVTIQVRPDPIVDRRRPWVVGMGRR